MSCINSVEETLNVLLTIDLRNLFQSSLVVPTAKTLSQCVFFSGFGDPEVYVRPDNTAYCTGFPDPPVRVTEHPGQEEVREDAIDKIQKSVELASSSSEHLAFVSQSGGDEQTVKQACYLPSTADGTPMMGPLQGLSNQYVSAGHTCWGILMGMNTKCYCLLEEIIKTSNVLSHSIHQAQHRENQWPI
jgi:glycine/D-amino acid oxidase-like deaminating enzyme